VTRTPHLKLWKLIPQQLAASPLYPIRYPANGILRQIFYKEVNMIHIHGHVYNLNIELFTGFTIIFFCCFRNFAFLYIPAILWRKKPSGQSVYLDFLVEVPASSIPSNKPEFW